MRSLSPLWQAAGLENAVELGPTGTEDEQEQEDGQCIDGQWEQDGEEGDSTKSKTNASTN